MKSIFFISGFCLLLNAPLNAPLYSQMTQIAFQGFEGTTGDTWIIQSGSDKISANTGSGDTPPNQRIRTGTKSWQVNNANTFLELDPISVSGYDSIQILIRLSSPSVNADNGSDSADSIRVFVGLNGNPFPSVADLSLNGNNNARWGYTGTLTATATAGQPASYTAPQGGTNTNNYATLRIFIPPGTQSVALKIQAKNNSPNELWCIDDIELRGVTVSAGPYIYPPVSPQNFLTSAGLPDTHQLSVAFVSLVSGLYAHIQGAQANLFSVIPDSFPAGSLSPVLFQIIYHPVSTGSHSATLIVSSVGANARSVTLNGNALASEPTYQPTNLQFFNVTETSFDVSFDPAPGLPDGYIALRKIGSPPSAIPADGQAYAPGTIIGDAIVAYSGNATTFTQNGLNPGTTYFFTIFSFNGSGSTTNYKTNNPLSGSQMTSGINQELIFPSLYGQQLIDSLRYYYKTSSTPGYDHARNKMFGSIDNFNDTVQCVYTGDRIRVLNNTGSPKDSAYIRGFNTEHTWPQSLGATGLGESDLHHLYPTRIDVNGARGNLPFNEIPDPLTQKWWRLNYNQTSIPTIFIDEYSESRSIDFEPREDHKGNVARAMFYFYTMYKSQSDTNFFHIQKNVLRQWHYADPVDFFERRRNDTIAFFQQKKKNPFILDSTLIRRAYFPPLIGMNDDSPALPREIILHPNYPNPFNPATTIRFEIPKDGYVHLAVFNTFGQEICTLVHRFLNAGFHSIQWNGHNNRNIPVSSGVYIYRLKYNDKTVSRKLLLLK